MAGEPIAKVLNALERIDARGLVTKQGERWQFPCPAHEDRKPSLSVTRNPDGTVLIHCHAGCSTETVLAALGLTVKDLFPNAQEIHPREQKITSRKNPAPGKNISERQNTNGKAYATAREALRAYGLGKPDAWWVYRNANGQEVMVVGRWNRPDGKEIRPVCKTPSGWKPGAPPPPRLLYNLPRILQASPDAPIIVVEGEKCADAVITLGFVATTSPNGAQAAKHADWTPLTGREVWILPDFDEAGRKYARDVTELVYQAGGRVVKVLGLNVLFPEASKTFPQGFDIADIVQGFREDANAEKLLADLAERIRDVGANTPPEPRPGDATAAETEAGGFDFQPIMVELENVESVPVRWLWPNRIPLGRITLLVGKPGVGKSFVTLDFTARVTTGTPWPDGSPCEKASVLILTLEDNPADTIRPRLDAMHADVTRVRVLKGVAYRDADGCRRERCLTLADLPAIEKALETLGDCRLLIVDPIGDFLGGQIDSHRDNEVRAVLTPLTELARRHNVAILVVMHRRKSFGDGGADETVMGSRGFTGIARSVWHVTRDANDKKRRLFLPGKQNLAEELPGLAFRIVGDSPWTRVEWEREPVNMSADEGLEAERQASRPGPEAEALEDAKAFLLTALSAGPRLAKDVLEDWKVNHGGCERTLHRAKAQIGVVSFREKIPGPWFWKLPESQHCQDTNNATLPTQIFWQSWQCLDKNRVSDTWGVQHCQDRQDCNTLWQPCNVTPGGTNTPKNAPPKVVDIGEINRRLMEAAEEDGSADGFAF
ncbi:MAG: AAA family ATPase [Thermogutta sp.]